MKSVYIVASLPLLSILVLAGEITREKRQTGIQLPQFDSALLPPLLATFLASLTVNAGRIALDNLNNNNNSSSSNPWFANCCEECLCSPNYPEPYPEDLDITWTITAPAERKVRLYLTDLEIYADEDNDYYENYPEYGSGDGGGVCIDGDYIEINDLDLEDIFGRSENIIWSNGANKNLKVTRDVTSMTMCGNLDSPYALGYTLGFLSSENEMTIRFSTTSDTKTAKGFRFFVTDDTGANTITTSYVLN